MHSTFLLVFVLSLACVVAGNKHHYQYNERVALWANNVGPFSNPSETYEFYTLPYCPPTVEERRSQRLGQLIAGDRAVLSEYNLPFKVDMQSQKLCDMNLSKEQLAKFIKAVKDNYYFELIFDDLPIFGFVGTTNSDKSNYYLYKHWHFTILYNGDQVIHINLTSSGEQGLQELSEDTSSFQLTYSANWISTPVSFSDRRDLYKSQYGFPFRSQLRIHWISIANSFVLVLLLTGFLFVTVMRMLRSDYAKYAILVEEEGSDDNELYGWKVIHGDVFRFPQYTSLLCGFLGIGTQFMSIVVGTLIFSLLGVFYPTNQGNIYATGIALYAVTAGFGGYVSAKYYKQFGGTKWVWNIVLVAVGLFAVPFACSFAFINGIAIHFKVTTALPFVTVLEVVGIWLLVGFPLTVIGGIAGRRLSGEFQAPVRTKFVPREIPQIPWYRTLPFQMVVAGFLPFTAIYIELFYIYSSVWGHYYYTFYGILCLVFIILNIVTACVTMSLTYFQLSSEDYRWWWNAFINGGSTAIFIYIYSIYYFANLTNMKGPVQAVFYFTYMFVACYVFFLLLGTVGFFSSLLFVRKIYQRIGGFD